MNLLVCPRCGAPLPASAASAPVVTCVYCAASTAIGRAPGGAVPETSEPTHPSGLSTAARAAFCQALSSALAAGAEPHETLVRAAREHLGQLGETDTMARVVLALAGEFEAESGASIRRDGVAMARIAEAYFAAIEAIRTSGRSELNLPFLAATAEGPKHFVRTLTAQGIGALAAKDPSAGAPKKKRGFWPFG